MFGQKSEVHHQIEGRVLDIKTKAPVPYANIYNKTLQKGTISNNNGYFRIEAKSIKDSISITFIGYVDHVLNLREDNGFYTVLLEENTQLLSEVVVTPHLNSYLFELVANCKKRPSKAQKSAKAYYELKTYRDSAQVELVEGFYNLDIQGYELSDLQLKAGRLAMQPYGDRYFASLESSLAISKSKLLEGNKNYPTSPLELTKRAMLKNYYLFLSKKYLDQEADSIYVVDFEPIKNNGQFYEGTLWINKSKLHILKINLRCAECRQYPFLPMFQTDSISNVSMNISKTFTEIDGDIFFNHVDFNYVVKYKSRPGKAEGQVYTVKTNAILYAYDFHHLFDLPKIEFTTENFQGRDYRLISAMPYNDFFWKNNDEYRLNERKNQNESYFDSPMSMTNKNVFRPNSKFKQTGLLEHPFVLWTQKRVRFREVMEDTTRTDPAGSFTSDKYKLAVKILTDINTYRDSTDIQTATIFDPYESYFYLSMDAKALCFINLYFDFCEIERRKLELELKAVRHDPAKLKVVQTAFDLDFEIRKKAFLKEVERGTKEIAVLKWNKYIREELGIDNVLIFSPFPEK